MSAAFMGMGGTVIVWAAPNIGTAPEVPSVPRTALRLFRADGGEVDLLEQ